MHYNKKAVSDCECDCERHNIVSFYTCIEGGTGTGESAQNIQIQIKFTKHANFILTHIKGGTGTAQNITYYHIQIHFLKQQKHTNCVPWLSAPQILYLAGSAAALLMCSEIVWSAATFSVSVRLFMQLNKLLFFWHCQHRSVMGFMGRIWGVRSFHSWWKVRLATDRSPCAWQAVAYTS